MNMMFNLPTGLTDSNGPRLTIEHGDFISHTSKYVRDASVYRSTPLPHSMLATAGNNRTPELCKRGPVVISTAGIAHLSTP